MPTSLAAPTWPAFDDAATLSNIVLVLEGSDESFVIDRDGLRIGASPVCELPLPNGPSLHSVIHQQSGVTWIETHDDANLMINGRLRRRMALRDGDVLELNGLKLTARFRSQSELVDVAEFLEDDLSQLSAEELCDRILSEQAMVDDFDEGRQAGWTSLMAAIGAAHDDEQMADTLPLAVEVATTSEDCERLFEQIRDLSEMMNGRTRELDECESELVAATTLLEEAQERLSQQIEGLLEQLHAPSGEIELRASA